VRLLILVTPMIAAPGAAPADYWAHTRYRDKARERYDNDIALFDHDVRRN
jgi:hypothetical protein